jgi:hypothetical protein
VAEKAVEKKLRDKQHRKKQIPRAKNRARDDKLLGHQRGVAGWG